MATTVRIGVWIGRVLSVLASLLFLLSALTILKGGEQVVQRMAHIGISENLMESLAILELCCVVLYLIPLTSVLGAILLTGYVGGAICTRLRIGDPFVMEIVLGVAIWLGLWLREARLSSLMPIRRRLR